jgi:hypothetical protein
MHIDIYICMNICIYIDCTSNVILSSINQMDIIMACHIYHLYMLMNICVHIDIIMHGETERYMTEN